MAVFYLLDAVRLFSDKSLEEVRELAFEIGMLGQYGGTRATPVGARPAGLAGETKAANNYLGLRPGR